MSLSKFGADIINHYNSLPKSSANAPYRHHLRPSEFVDVVPWCMIAVSKAPKHMEITLCGSAIEHLYGLNVTGLDMFKMYPEDEVEKYALAFDHMFKQPCGFSTSRIFSTQFMSARKMDMMALPLANKEGKIDRMIVWADVSEKSSPNFLEDLGDKSSLRLRKTLSFSVFDIGFGVPQAEGLEIVDISDL